MQTAHSVADFAAEFPAEFKKWKQDSNSIISLSCKSEEELLRLFDKFSEVTPTVKFFEPDIDTNTSICLLGTPDVRRRLSHLPLALKNVKPKKPVLV